MSARVDSSKKSSPKPSKKAPRRSKGGAFIGAIVGAALALAGAWAAYTYLLPKPSAEPAPDPAPAVVEPEAPKGYRRLDGPPPGPETPYPGSLAAYARWADDAGEALAIVWTEPLEAASAERTDSVEPVARDGAVRVGARLYRQAAAGWTLAAERAETTGLAAGLYRDGLWPGDYDGDGRGEALLAYWTSLTPEPGPRRLSVATVADGGIFLAEGTTRFYPPAGKADAKPRAASTRLLDGVFARAPEALRTEAARLWDEAQYDLAEPSAHPDFHAHERFDGATLQGTERNWRLVVLPAYMELSLDGDAETAAIRYESIRAEDGGLVAEGKATIEGWEHAFRVSIAERPVKAPDGIEYPLEATLDWSDGTRLAGWGRLAEE